MFSPDQLNLLLKNMMTRLCNMEEVKSCKINDMNSKTVNQGNGNFSEDQGNKVSIAPSQALIIAGILGGTLEVDSILVDKDQTVQIVLQGSLKQKTQLDKIMDQIGAMPFDEVIKAMMGRL
ncbi:MAG: hypothetical protein N2645_10255 [Clostridia bacterium]|nr:hypothetical protein [Clostridia bacterium]